MEALGCCTADIKEKLFKSEHLAPGPTFCFLLMEVHSGTKPVLRPMRSCDAGYWADSNKISEDYEPRGARGNAMDLSGCLLMLFHHIERTIRCLEQDFHGYAVLRINRDAEARG